MKARLQVLTLASGIITTPFLISSLTGFCAIRTEAQSPVNTRTVIDKYQPAGPTPPGMVWIPGGEFAMGSDQAGEALCSISGVTHGAQPIHRVFRGWLLDGPDRGHERAV